MASCEVDSQQNSQLGRWGALVTRGQPAEQSAGSSGGALAAMGHAGSPGAGGW